MKIFSCVATLAAAAALGAVVLRAADDPAGPGYPAWAYALRRRLQRDASRRASGGPSPKHIR